jgi:hypothetical protein
MIRTDSGWVQKYRLWAVVDGELLKVVRRGPTGGEAMQVNPYLSFNGQCEAAFKFYEQCLGGQLGAIFRYARTPLADQVPADWQDKVMHGSLTVGEQVLRGAT